jgi:hypothetical protein
VTLHWFAPCPTGRKAAAAKGGLGDLPKIKGRPNTTP